MDEEVKNKLRPIYSQLQDTLTQAPEAEGHALWDHYHEVIKELSDITGEEFESSRVSLQRKGKVKLSIYVTEYRTKLSGLVARLHSKYFLDEPAPFAGMPSTSINVNQQQSQAMLIQIRLEIQSQIESKLHGCQDPKKKTYLEIIKRKLSTITSVTQLIALILNTAKEVRLDIQEISQIFQ